MAQAKKANIAKTARQFGLIGVTLIIIIVMSFVSPVFMTKQNIINVLRQISLNGILTVGMTCVILTGGIDLSVGSVIAVTGVIAGSLMINGTNWAVACLAALIPSLLIGAFNGYMVSYVGFQPFIATLSTQVIGRGAALAYSNGKPYLINNESFLKIGQGYVGVIPIPIILLFIVCIIGYIILTKTTFGRYIFAIGGNKNAAKLAGVRTERTGLMVYMLSAVCAWVVGLILAARISSGQPTAGEAYEMDAIAATAIGGTSMNGGVGSLIGSFTGFILIGLLSNSMNLLNINSFYQQIVKGVLIIVAVLLDMKTKGKSK